MAEPPRKNRPYTPMQTVQPAQPIYPHPLPLCETISCGGEKLHNTIFKFPG